MNLLLYGTHGKMINTSSVSLTLYLRSEPLKKKKSVYGESQTLNLSHKENDQFLDQVYLVKKFTA